MRLMPSGCVGRGTVGQEVGSCPRLIHLDYCVEEAELEIIRT